MDREALPPLLRGLGTLLLLVASALAVMIERHEDRRLAATIARFESAATSGTAADPRDAQIAALSREVRSLRRRTVDQDLVDRVFENPSFQLLGLLGTALLASSFFLEAWQKRRPADGAEDGPDDQP